MASEKNSVSLLLRYVTKQLENLFPIVDPEPIQIETLNLAIERTNRCITKIKATQGSTFDPMNSGHYATFLYFLSRELWLSEHNVAEATRVFLLNKALNGIDLFYEINMPDIFLIGHTAGMVFAKATYSDYCVFHQGCTVGRNGTDRPRIQTGVVLYPNASVIGDCLVRENSIITPGVNLIDHDTPGNCYVFMGQKGKPVFKEINEYFIDRYFYREK
jgi:serine O-acetyltransferase